MLKGKFFKPIKLNTLYLSKAIQEQKKLGIPQNQRSSENSNPQHNQIALQKNVCETWKQPKWPQFNISSNQLVAV